MVRRYMDERGMSLRGLAAAAHYDPGLLSKVLRGQRPHSEYLARRLDGALGAGGEIIAAAQQAPPRARWRPSRRKTSGAVEALQAAMTGDPDDGAGIGAEGLADLVLHYAHEVAVTPSAAVYDELVSARSFAGSLLVRVPAQRRPDVTVTAGWLSSLLAVSAADLGDHAAAVVWCTDAERRGRDAGFPEPLGWAALTRALIAWYQGSPARSAAFARRGQAQGQPGTVAHAKLAAQEMRCLAMLGDAEGMTAARRRAAGAMAQLGASAATSGIYSVPRDTEPPYTATALLLTGQHAEAAEVTRRLISAVYRPQNRPAAGQPTNYARTLLVLALAAAGMGDADEAAAAGTAALECGRVVWSTMVLAGKLDESLALTAPGSPHAVGFRARYLDAGTRLARPAAPAAGRDRG